MCMNVFTHMYLHTHTQYRAVFAIKTTTDELAQTACTVLYMQCPAQEGNEEFKECNARQCVMYCDAQTTVLLALNSIYISFALEQQWVSDSFSLLTCGIRLWLWMRLGREWDFFFFFIVTCVCLFLSLWGMTVNCVDNVRLLNHNRGMCCCSVAVFVGKL